MSMSHCPAGRLPFLSRFWHQKVVGLVNLLNSVTVSPAVSPPPPRRLPSCIWSVLIRPSVSPDRPPTEGAAPAPAGCFYPRLSTRTNLFDLRPPWERGANQLTTTASTSAPPSQPALDQDPPVRALWSLPGAEVALWAPFLTLRPRWRSGNLTPTWPPSPRPPLVPPCPQTLDDTAASSHGHAALWQSPPTTTTNLPNCSQRRPSAPQGGATGAVVDFQRSSFASISKFT